MQKPSISVVIPTLNEEGNVDQLVKRLDEVLSGCASSYQLIFVDDHSADGTCLKLEKLSRKYPIIWELKEGKRGKAYSLLQGFRHCKNDLAAIIDADLQYPPENIPAMIEKIQNGIDVVVANRKEREVSLVRRIFSKTFAFVFSRMLHGLNFDVQAGLKVFRREVVEDVNVDPSPWTFDLEFLLMARNYGYKIGSVDIPFLERTAGESKVICSKAIWEIGSNAVKLKFKQLKPLLIKPKEPGSMIGAGVAHNRKRFITHTTLDTDISALDPW